MILKKLVSNSGSKTIRSFFYGLNILSLVIFFSCNKTEQGKTAGYGNDSTTVFIDSVRSSNIYNQINFIRLLNNNKIFTIEPYAFHGNYINLFFADSVFISKIKWNTDNFISGDSVDIFINKKFKNRILLADTLLINENIRELTFCFMQNSNLTHIYGTDFITGYRIFKTDTIIRKVNSFVFYGLNNQLLKIKTLPVSFKQPAYKFQTAKSVLHYYFNKPVLCERTDSLQSEFISLIINSDLSFSIISLNAKDSLKNYKIEKGKWMFESEFNGKVTIKLFCNDFNNKPFGENLYLTHNKIWSDSLIKPIFTILPDDFFVEVSKISDIVLDIRYATTNNFTKKQLYACPQAWLRYAVARDLENANNDFKKLGYKILLFDGYRPLTVQRIMWETMPNINYVAPPDKGSIHNRGGAVDLSLVDSLNKEVNMGTEYDFFGREAFHDYTNLPVEILNNRILLKTILERWNFKAIRTEWWHYSHKTCLQYPITDFMFKCK